jgi:hypothetical protein|tara:strand:+ start:1178 stop:1414 length:237 start_codon:yes stop_codon:yes gene_type:complete
MSTHEKKWIADLQSKGATTAAQKDALAKIGDYMEESFILNLPPSQALLKGLKAFAKKPKTATALKSEANRLIKAYQTQ